MGGSLSKRRKKYDRNHCRGPLDGSLYAKVNKNKKAEHVDLRHVTPGEEKKPHTSTNHELEAEKSTPNQKPENKELTNQISPPKSNVVVVNGNRIIFKPDPEIEYLSRTRVSAPLATLAEFESSSLSIASSHETVTSLASVTRLTVTSSPSIKSELVETSSGNKTNMAEGTIQQTAAQIVDDVINNTSARKKESDVTNPQARFSEISSCSATTLSSTSTEDGEVHQELSDHDSSSLSSTDDQLRTLKVNVPPGTAKGNISPEILLEKVLDNATPPPLADNDTEVCGPETQEILPPTDRSVEVLTEESAPTFPPPKLPDQGMYNGAAFLGSYDKGPEYAVPMRDMKITTIPSKRAVLVSTGSENENMATQSPGDRRDSVYDEGNMSYNGAGYATIEEYAGDQHAEAMGARAESREQSQIPDDVQELLNGLQEGPTISDIDSGFHGSSMNLPAKNVFEHNNMASQSSGEFSETFSSPQPTQSNEPSPTFDGGYPMATQTSFHSPPSATNYLNTSVGTEIAGPSSQYHEVSPHPPKKNRSPGIPIATQTLPEPEPARVQIITMKNVYTNDQTFSQAKTTIPSPNDNVARPADQHQLEKKYQGGPSRISPDRAALPGHDNAMETVTMRTKEAVTGLATMSPDTMMEPWEDDVEDQLESENIQNVEEQIKHAQMHLEFLKDQQEKLIRRKEDRSRYKETLKRNSSAFETHSPGYAFSPGMSSTMPRQPYRPPDDRKEKTPAVPVAAQTAKADMPPITNQGAVVGSPVQQSQPQNVWNANTPKLTRQASDTSHNRNGSAQPPLPVKKVSQPVRQQDKDDIIMSTDLQEQLAELDRCIAELTTSMDIPDVQDSKPEESLVVRRRKSFSMEIDRKMDPNIPEDEPDGAPTVPNPPARSRSSFDSYKRLSQEFDINIKQKSSTDQGGSDDVFSPGPQVPRKKKQSPFPPQTSVTRRQHMAPAPPPKRRLSLEERLSPGLMQAMAVNPGAKPKEDIHSYKEDLAPDNLPDTPTFPLSPSTPYVNNDPPARAKSPPGLVKTPLSVLHLKPTETPTEGLHHPEIPNKTPPAVHTSAQPRPEQTSAKPPPEPMKITQPGQRIPISEPASAIMSVQNGHAKETALLNDGQGTRMGPQDGAFNQKPQQKDVMNGQSHMTQPTGQPVHTKVVSVKRDIQPEHVTPPSHLNLPQTNLLPGNLHGTPHQNNDHRTQQISNPQQYQHNHSGASHSSHSPVATSSNSRNGSSDSLDGPSTRHSNSSLLSSSSSSSAPAPHSSVPAMAPGVVTPPNNIVRPGSQASSYDRNLHPPITPGTRSGDESIGSPQSGRTSSSSISDIEKMNYDVSHATVSAAPKFIRDTTAYWYKPDITRDQALAILRNKPAGSFVIRDSRCFPGAFGLALKVDKLPPNVQPRNGVDLANEYVRHFLIEPSSRGVKLKGCPNEPVFGSLSALVYQHSITALALPCKLIIPTADQEIPQPGSISRPSQVETPSPSNTAADLLKQGAACNVIYIGSVDTESLTGPPAIERAIRETYQVAKANPNMTSIVHFKVSPQGITLTDNARRIFFRRHYPTETVTYCGLDPLGSKGAKPRRWDATSVRGGPDAHIFGFVARKQAGSWDNSCHVFAELDSAQPARAIVNFVMKVLLAPTRQNSS